MFNKNLSKFIDKKATRAYLNYVFYNKSTGEYVATEGHIMGIEKTPDTYNTDKFLSPREFLKVIHGLKNLNLKQIKSCKSGMLLLISNF